MLEIGISIISALILYQWVHFIGKKSLKLNKIDPERKSNKWLFGEISNMLIIFSLWVGPVILFNLNLTLHFTLFIFILGFIFYVFYKNYYQELKITFDLQKNKSLTSSSSGTDNP